MIAQIITKHNATTRHKRTSSKGKRGHAAQNELHNTADPAIYIKKYKSSWRGARLTAAPPATSRARRKERCGCATLPITDHATAVGGGEPTETSSFCSSSSFSLFVLLRRCGRNLDSNECAKPETMLRGAPWPCSPSPALNVREAALTQYLSWRR